MIIANKEHIPQLKALWKEAFGDSDEFLDYFFQSIFPSVSAFAEEVDGEIASALYAIPCFFNGKPTVYIYAVATLKKFRSRGICSGLIKSTHKQLWDAGYKGAILSPQNEALFEFYKSFGYIPCCRLDRIAIKASEGEFTAKEIPAEEYFDLRKKSLPANAIIETKAQIDVLKFDTRFYATPHSLFAVRDGGNGEMLDCIEYSGNINEASQLLGALNYKSGTFPMRNGTTSIAAYVAFDGDPILPEYLGFTLN